MGDRIREFQEEMIPEVEAWVDAGLLTKGELKMVIQKRTDFEYKMRGADKADYLRYIRFEAKLDELVHTRLRQTPLEKKVDVVYSCRKRISGIFSQAERRWKDDPTIYMLHIDFCKKFRMTHELRGVYTKALHCLPHKVEFWVMAALYEWEENKNVLGARALLQSSLRVNPRSATVWCEYFFLELSYWREATSRINKSLMAPLFTATANSIDVSQVTEAGSSDADNTVLRDILNHEKLTPFLLGQIPAVVYSSALNAMGREDLRFRLSLFEVARKFKIAAKLQQTIMDEVNSDFPHNPLVVALQADTCVRGFPNALTNITSACDVFEKALKSVASPDLLSGYLRFIEHRLSRLSLADDVEVVAHLTGRLMSLVDWIVSSGLGGALLSGSVVSLALHALQALGQDSKAYEFVCHATLSTPRNAKNWTCRMELEIKLGKPSEDVFGHFEKAVKQASSDVSLWTLYIQWLSTADNRLALLDGDIVNEAMKIGEKGNALLAVSLKCLKGLFSILKVDQYSYLKSQLLDTIVFHCDIDSTRSFIQHSLSIPPNSFSYYQHCIAVEEAQPPATPASTTPSSFYSLQNLYERTVQEYGSDDACEEVWLKYIQFESCRLRMDRAADIYYRAKKTLKNSESFISKVENSSIKK